MAKLLFWTVISVSKKKKQALLHLKQISFQHMPLYTQIRLKK